jgi:predicted nucleic acid-binding protein
VILVDANLLIYADSINFAQHVAARKWLDEQINASVRIGLPWGLCLHF